MAATLSYRAFLRSVFIRYGGWQQNHIRPFCKGPPDNPTDESKTIEKSEWDKQREKINKSEGTPEQNSSSSSTSSSSSSSDSDESPVKEEASQSVKSTVSDKGKVQTVEKSPGQSIQQDKASESVEDKRAAAKKKLNDLLLSLATTDPVPMEPVTKLDLAKPKPRKKAEKKKPVVEEENEQAKTSQTSEEIHIEPALVAASKEVAESLGGDVKTTESELLSILRSHATETSFDDKPTASLSELFVGMKVERSQSKPVVEQRQHRPLDRVPTDQPQSLFDREFQRRKAEVTKPGRAREQMQVDLFGSKILGIFDAEKQKKEQASIPDSILNTWDAAHLRELELSVTYPPTNAFVEMIQWTKQGKLWPLPVDNEIGLEEEKKVGFHEHVFLEHHLEGWCPKRGPIRHFMELVCTGLSKNPYLTVERKLRHINWYKNYFEEKHDILKTIGAIEAEQ